MRKDRFVFHTFIEAPANRFAAAACRAVAARMGEAYNPLWLYGPSGSGKTHLLGAIAHSLKQEARQVCFVTAEAVMRALLHLVGGEDAAWKVLEQCDALLIDDIGLFCGKETAQGELVRLLDRKCRNGQAVVLASHRPPAEFSALSEWLQRANGALVADLSLPDAALRGRYAADYVAAHGLQITEEARDCLVESTGSIPQLQGAFRAVAFWNYMSGQPATLPWVKRYVDFFKE